MRVTVVTPPTFEPITVADAKSYCRVTHSLEDTLFEHLISSARAMCENYSRVPFCRQTFKAEYRWPKHDTIFGLRSRLDDPDCVDSGIELPRHPIAGVSTVKVLNLDNGDTLELSDGADYVALEDRVVIKKEIPYVTHGAYFGLYGGEAYTHVYVTFDAGWSKKEDGEVSTCPQNMKQCVREQVAFLYQNRGDSAATLSSKVKSMLKNVAAQDTFSVSG